MPWLSVLQDAIRTYLARTIAGRQAHRTRILAHRTRLDRRRPSRDCRHRPLLYGRFLIFVGDQSGPAERRYMASSETHGVLDFPMEMRDIDEWLLRHAAGDHTCAAHAALFYKHNASVVEGCDPRSGPRPLPTDKQVDVVFSFRLPACPQLVWRVPDISKNYQPGRKEAYAGYRQFRRAAFLVLPIWYAVLTLRIG